MNSIPRARDGALGLYACSWIAADQGTTATANLLDSSPAQNFWTRLQIESLWDSVSGSNILVPGAT